MLKKALLTAFLFFYSAGYISAQTYPFWSSLEPGPHLIGNDVIWSYDQSRTWQEEKDYKGNILDDIPLRPVRISVWYPASPKSGVKHMSYEDYIFIQDVPDTFLEVNNQIEEYDWGTENKGIRGIFKGEEQAVQKLIATKVASYWQAEPNEGAFPLIVYSLGQNNYTQENTVLWEYLASHGYVVAVIPHLGVSPRSNLLLIHKQSSYEAQVRDLEYVIQAMHEFPNADKNKIAVMGHSMGGVYSLLLAMRHKKVDAYIGLDPAVIFNQASYAYKYQEAYDYDPDIKIPMLLMHKSSNDLTFDRTDQFRFSDRHFLEFHQLNHGDFTSIPMITSQLEEGQASDYLGQDETPESALAGFVTIAENTRIFLDSIFNDQSFNPLRTEDFSYEIKESLNIPTEEEYYIIVKEKGYANALELLKEMQHRYPKATLISEKVMNSLAYEMTYLGKTSEAISLFKLNAEAHPKSFDAHYNLAEGYRMTGNNKMAIKHYEKSLEISPDNKKATKRIETLQSNN